MRAEELGRLLTSILSSIVDAERQLSRNTLDFILDLTEERDGRVEPRYMEFQYRFRRVDEEGRLREGIERVRIPLLTLVNIPSLGVENAELEVSMDILTVAQEAGKPRIYVVPRRVREESRVNLKIKIKLSRIEPTDAVSTLYTSLINNIFFEREEIGGEEA